MKGGGDFGVNNIRPIKAVVQKVVKKAKHGPYAVATSEGVKGSITFSLGEGIWKEKSLPERGYVVLLNDLRKKRAGWRAEQARFLRPADEN